MRTCQTSTCDNAATQSWQRWATPAEVAKYKASRDLPPRETDARVLVVACDQHALEPHLAVHTHQATCTAPPTCSCTEM